MTILGTLFKNRRAGETHGAWNRENLQAPELLSVTSEHFGDGEPMPLPHAGRRIGGRNVSPQLAWSAPPPGTAALLLVVEDIDVPMGKPAVHCAVLIDPSRLDGSPLGLPEGALAAKSPAAGVRVLRSTIGRGYHGPEPIKGHGPHRYTFQLFALGSDPGTLPDGTAAERRRPRDFLASLTTPVLARGRLTGTYER
jgi:hypothetical protein